jgi:hypothetical protein
VKCAEHAGKEEQRCATGNGNTRRKSSQAISADVVWRVRVRKVTDKPIIKCGQQQLMLLQTLFELSKLEHTPVETISSCIRYTFSKAALSLDYLATLLLKLSISLALTFSRFKYLVFESVTRIESSKSMNFGPSAFIKCCIC